MKRRIGVLCASVSSLKMKMAYLSMLILALAFAGVSYADGHGRSRGVVSSPLQQFEGVVKSVSATSLVITDAHNADHTFALTAATVIHKGDQRVQPSALAVGDRVHVAAGIQDGVLTAMDVYVQDDGDNEVEASGTVTGVGVQQLTLHTHDADLTVKINTSTIIRSAGKAITLGDIKVGDLAEVKGTRVDATTILASVIEIEPEPEATAEGTVTAVGTGQFTLHTRDGHDVTVKVDATTIIHKGDQTITLADIKVGDMAAVRGKQIDATTIQAAEVEIEVPDDHGEATAEGTVSALGTGQFTLHTRDGHDVTIKVDSATVIHKGDHTITFADIKVGDVAAVKGRQVDATTIQAAEVEIEVPDTNVEVEGTVSAVGTGQLTVATEDHGHITVQVSSTTRIHRGGRAIALGDIHVGDRVSCQGTRVDDHTMLATDIEVGGSGGGHS